MSDPQRDDETYLDWLERQAKKAECTDGNLNLDPVETLDGIAETRRCMCDAVIRKVTRDGWN